VTTDPTTPQDGAGGRLEAAIDRAEAELARATAGRALCRIDGSGGPTPYFVKRAEGARAALGDVRRRVRRGAGLGEACAATLDLWRADLERWRASGSGPWIAYREGGCASVEALMGDMANNSAGTSDASPA
jgi:hypothetical protein